MLKIKLFETRTVNELELVVNYFLNSAPMRIHALQYQSAGEKHVFLLTYAEVINAIEEGKVEKSDQ